jgi:hypothetical protein
MEQRTNIFGMIKRSFIILAGFAIITVFLVNRFACDKKPDENQVFSAQQLYDRANDHEKPHDKLKTKKFYQ